MSGNSDLRWIITLEYTGTPNPKGENKKVLLIESKDKHDTKSIDSLMMSLANMLFADIESVDVIYRDITIAGSSYGPNPFLSLNTGKILGITNKCGKKYLEWIPRIHDDGDKYDENNKRCTEIIDVYELVIPQLFPQL